MFNNKITFGIIVLNGEPFTRYCIRAIYPYSHQIIIVEGATKNAVSISTETGHSIDGTLEVLKDIKNNFDPDNKIDIVTAEDEGHPNGFWPGEKDEMSKSYARRCTGDWLWQIDVDEFYLDSSITSLIEFLSHNQNISAVSFDMMTFWGALDVTVDGYYLRSGARYYHRLFRWKPGYKYITHRPPTVVDENGNDLRSLCWLDGKHSSQLGIKLFHYSLLFPKQVLEKSKYYEQAMRPESVNWANNNYFKLSDPFRVHNVFSYPSWLEKYSGVHPDRINEMISDINKGLISTDLRPMNDVYSLLNSYSYRFFRFLYKILYYTKLFNVIRYSKRIYRSILKRVFNHSYI